MVRVLEDDVLQNIGPQTEGNQMTKKSRRGGLIAIVSAITVVGIVLGAPRCGSDEPKKYGPVEVTQTTTVVPKPPAAPAPAPSRKPHYVIVDKDGPVPNIEPPTKLYVRGMKPAECADAGGTFDGATGMCRNVDY